MRGGEKREPKRKTVGRFCRVIVIIIIMQILTLGLSRHSGRESPSSREGDRL